MYTTNQHNCTKESFITNEGVKVTQVGKPNILLLAKKLLDLKVEEKN